jgi:outer membrane autotransporter protein
MSLLKLRRSLGLGGALFVFSVVCPEFPMADDFVIDTAVTTQNGGNTLDGNDSLTVTSSGSVTTTGTTAVRATGINNTIDNSGSISTTGTSADGIRVFNSNTVNNSGSIQTTGNDSDGIEVDDSNVVVNSGSIVTSGNDSYGIFAGDNNNINNSSSDTISTTGDRSDGINANDNNTINNSGTIVTSGFLSFGISGEDSNTITNSSTDTISTTGNEATGIQVDDNNTLVNSGAIKTTGRHAQAIKVDDNNHVTHSGSISTTGNTSDGIDIDDQNTLVVSGSIETTGADADGIDTEDSNTVTVSGTILTKGADSDGIEADNDNTINVSGKIVSSHAASLNLGTGNKLNLSAPAFLGGTIVFGTGTDITITTGQSHSVLWDFSTGTPNSFSASGPVPWFYNTATQQFATFDPTVFAANVNQLAEWTSLLTQLTRGQLGAGQSGSAGSSQFAYGTGQMGDKHHVWVRGFGSDASYDAQSYVNAYDYRISGVAAGIDGYVRDDFKLGLIGGYFTGDMTANGTFATSYRNDSNNWFTGVYGRKTRDRYFVDFSLVGGYQSVDQWRFVNNNLAYLGNGSANASYNSWYITPEVSVSSNVATWNGWTVQPTARARYTYQMIDGYSETGSSANAVVNGQQVQLAEGRLELGLHKTHQMIDTRIYGGYLGRYSFGDDTVGVTMLTIANSIPTGVDDYQSLGYAGADIAFNLTGMAAIRAGVIYAVGDGSESISGSAGLTVEF